MNINPEIAQRDFSLLSEWLLVERGLDLRGYKDKCIKRRLAVRIRARGQKDLKGYFEVLKNDRVELDELMSTLTINVSSFFRNPGVFEALAGDIIPRLIKHRKSKRQNRLSIWSAGCAGGEEPYSLAILLRRHFKTALSKMEVQILATDIDDESLKRAKQGVFPAERFEDTRPEIIEKYFTQVAGGFQVADCVRNLVSFKHHDLLEAPELDDLDLILCRNVLIYLTRDQQRKLLLYFQNALHQVGYLVLGQTEVLVGDIRNGFEGVNPKERVYRKDTFTWRG